MPRLARHRVLDWHGQSISAAVREHAAITAAAAWSPPPALAAALDRGDAVEIGEQLVALRLLLPGPVRILLTLTPTAAERAGVALALWRGGAWPRRAEGR